MFTKTNEEVTYEQELKQKVESVIRSTGMSKQKFCTYYNIPDSYLRRLGISYDNGNSVPPKAIKWFETLVEKGSATPKYDKVTPPTSTNIQVCEGTTKVPEIKGDSTEEKLCLKCGAKDHRKEAKFCYVCGSPLKTHSEFIIASLESIRSDITILPSSSKDRIRDILIMAVDYIREISNSKGR